MAIDWLVSRGKRHNPSDIYRSERCFFSIISTERKVCNVKMQSIVNSISIYGWEFLFFVDFSLVVAGFLCATHATFMSMNMLWLFSFRTYWECVHILQNLCVVRLSESNLDSSDSEQEIKDQQQSDRIQEENKTDFSSSSLFSFRWNVSRVTHSWACDDERKTNAIEANGQLFEHEKAEIIDSMGVIR